MYLVGTVLHQGNKNNGGKHKNFQRGTSMIKRHCRKLLATDRADHILGVVPISAIANNNARPSLPVSTRGVQRRAHIPLQCVGRTVPAASRNSTAVNQATANENNRLVVQKNISCANITIYHLQP